MLKSTVRCLARGSNFEGAELEEALAESAFLPEGYEAPQQLGAARRSYLHGITRKQHCGSVFSGLSATTDAREAALVLVDVATLWSSRA
jgi:hypothetical protein